MKTLITVLPALLLGQQALANEPAVSAETNHRYVIERTFPAGALDGLDANVKAQVNANNARFHVRWVMSYANADRTKTYCIYEGPSSEAVRSAAVANKLPVDSITEVPVTLQPQ